MLQATPSLQPQSPRPAGPPGGPSLQPSLHCPLARARGYPPLPSPPARPLGSQDPALWPPSTGSSSRGQCRRGSTRRTKPCRPWDQGAQHPTPLAVVWVGRAGRPVAKTTATGARSCQRARLAFPMLSVCSDFSASFSLPCLVDGPPWATPCGRLAQVCRDLVTHAIAVARVLAPSMGRSVCIPVSDFLDRSTSEAWAHRPWLRSLLLK